MTRNTRYRVTCRLGDGTTRRVCRVWYGANGSWYVSTPVSPTQRAVLLIMTINYAKAELAVKLREAVDSGEATAAKKEIKYSHHPDGFAQFSGAGLLSGRESDGKAKGIGILTWALEQPTMGPAFALAVNHAEEFLLETDDACENVTLMTHAPPSLTAARQLILEGYYFPAVWRRFVYVRDGIPMLTIAHPCRAMLELRVLFPPPLCPLQGFLALDMYDSPFSDEVPPPGFIFSGPTGNLRRNDQGELLGDGLFCFYPDDERLIESVRSIDYAMNPFMPELAYQDPPSDGADV